MATVTSSSADAQVKDAYDDNASYLEDKSLAKAKAFSTAVRILIRRTARQRSIDGANLEFDIGALRKELEDAQEFVGKYDDFSSLENNNTTHGDFTSYRE